MPNNTPEYQAEYYQRNKEKRVRKIRDRQMKIKDQVQALKLENGCSRCGYNRCAQALQFHHHNDDKEGNIARWTAQGHSFGKILGEIQKCVLLCANCHAEEHANMAC